MLSRVADNLYWMSRYLERAEHTARLMGVHLNLMLEHEPASQDRRWWRVLAGFGQRRNRWKATPFAVAQAYALNQIVDSIAAARENARQVREQISSEMWEEIQPAVSRIQAHRNAPSFSGAQPHDLLLTRHAKRAPVHRASRIPPCCMARVGNSSRWAVSWSACRPPPG